MRVGITGCVEQQSYRTPRVRQRVAQSKTILYLTIFLWFIGDAQYHEREHTRRASRIATSNNIL